MRFSWAQTVAGGLTFAVVAGLLLLPGRLLGPDRPIAVAVPLPEKAVSVQAAPPLRIPHLQKPRVKAPAAATVTTRRYTYVARPRTVSKVTSGQTLLKAHRSAVIRRLAPTAPLVRARVLAAVSSVPRPAAKPVRSSAQTIAALAASLSKK
jgi:hypothetical protein